MGRKSVGILKSVLITQGESGGPLIDDGLQVGVVSYGSHGCADAKHPVIYARVTNFLSWIEKANK